MIVKHMEDQNQFVALDENQKPMGELAYRPGDDNCLYATHTEVFPPNEGKGVAGEMLKSLCGYAREEGKKIVPVCSYVVHAFNKNPEKYEDLAKK